MKVLKFGGTSIATADRMHEVIDIIEQNSGAQIIVLSAMAGTTNHLVKINESIISGDLILATLQIDELQAKYDRVFTDLYPNKPDRDRGRGQLTGIFDLLRAKVEEGDFSHRDEKEILAQGELMSTALFAILCELRHINVALIPALDFMRTSAQGEPDYGLIDELVQPYLDVLDDDLQIIVTQGYICRDADGYIDNLLRGGSDYTATILGAATKSDEIQIWTDIDGVHNNDPRIVDHTSPIRKLSYREAAELAYFGAKILHPACVLPAEAASVPVRLKCTMDPEAPGTLISHETSNRAITAVAAKDGITAVKILSGRMLNAHGFIRQVAQVFERYETSVDMITTSEVAVSLTIDDTRYLDKITTDLAKIGSVEVSEDQTIVCIVGNALYDNMGHIRGIFNALGDIPIRMVSMGGSLNNVSILIPSQYKKQALIGLNDLFEQPSKRSSLTRSTA